MRFPEHSLRSAPAPDTATFTSNTLEFDGGATTFMLLLPATAELRIWTIHSEHSPGKN